MGKCIKNEEKKGATVKQPAPDNKSGRRVP